MYRLSARRNYRLGPTPLTDQVIKLERKVAVFRLGSNSIYEQGNKNQVAVSGQQRLCYSFPWFPRVKKKTNKKKEQ